MKLDLFDVTLIGAAVIVTVSFTLWQGSGWFGLLQNSLFGLIGYFTVTWFGHLIPILNWFIPEDDRKQ